MSVIEQRIPGAQLSFKPDTIVVELLSELGSIEISDDCGQIEWVWQFSWPLEAMVDDYIDEFEKHKSYFV